MKKNFLRIIPVILVLFCSAVFFLFCSQDDNRNEVLNSQQLNPENERFHVKNAGFSTLNQSYEEYKARILKIEKSGTPYTEEMIRLMYQEALKYDRLLYDEGFDGYPTNEEVEKRNATKSISGTITSKTTYPNKFVKVFFPHYYEWDSTENPNGYNWCGHAALKATASYHGSLKTLSQIHTAFSNNSSAYVNGGKGRCNDYEYCASMVDLLWMANNQNNKTWNYNFPTTSTVTKSTIASFFQQLRDGVDYNKPVIVASNYLESYGHFYPVVGYKLVTTSSGTIDYNNTILYLRNVQYSVPTYVLYDNAVSVQTFFNQRRSNDLLVVRPWQFVV